MKHKVSELNLHFINTRNPEPHQLNLCESAYKFWKNSWTDTFKSLGVEKNRAFNSDDFLDREVTGLFCNKAPVALFFSNWFDLDRKSITDHSYFNNYPQGSFSTLDNLNFKNIMVLTYMTVHPEWRSKNTDLPIPDILFSISVKRFLQKDGDAILGYIRRDKSFFESFYRHGAIRYAQSTAYNVPVDFCYIPRDQAKISPIIGLSEAVDSIWNSSQENKKTERTAA